MDPAHKMNSGPEMHDLSLKYKDERMERSYRLYRYELIIKKHSVIIIINVMLYIIQTSLTYVNEFRV